MNQQLQLFGDQPCVTCPLWFRGEQRSAVSGRVYCARCLRLKREAKRILEEVRDDE